MEQTKPISVRLYTHICGSTNLCFDKPGVKMVIIWTRCNLWRTHCIAIPYYLASGTSFKSCRCSRTAASWAVGVQILVREYDNMRFNRHNSRAYYKFRGQHDSMISRGVPDTTHPFIHIPRPDVIDVRTSIEAGSGLYMSLEALSAYPALLTIWDEFLLISCVKSATEVVESVVPI